MDNLISIIIPTYNRAYCLPAAIDSVSEQKGVRWELIIIDDGSTDATRSILDSYKDVAQIRHYYQEHRGVSAARNHGVFRAKGDYLIFLDSDDSFQPGLLKCLREEEYWKFDLICWEVLKKVDGKSSHWKPVGLEKIYNNITASFLAGSACYKKKIFEEAGGFDPSINFGENYELGIRISQLKDLKVHIISRLFLIYNINTKLRESNSVQNKLLSIENLLVKHKELYLFDPLSHARLVYQIGLLKQQSGKSSEAMRLYIQAYKIKPDYLKPLLRYVLLKGKKVLAF
ncbi:glycosyltransferase family 2 protein [Antarcticibacterium flavum]|uniref:Glycosyltransferase family 2 protein n=1 Tax=Antarcticibacterium flavum TaxID=2058175 RepID=A0A5B7WZJ0_9FLAO|nr:MULTISPECIES: glycosyltransferase family A protein [Antarcticibacterium]MCM4158765.1 hypothetical protein [Antarcticibacterium sp. W02-3]QCY68616.1 glycosyltransferase family 2 protein [Antarcticibacterium flavum]